jgi:hypothetical protein
MHTDGELVIEVEPSPCRPIQIVMWTGSGELSARACMHDPVRACARARERRAAEGPAVPIEPSGRFVRL